MNGDGLGGECNSLGAYVDGKYEVSDECAGMVQILKIVHIKLSPFMRKPAFCIYAKKQRHRSAAW